MADPTPGPWHIGGIHGHKGSTGPDCKQSIHAGPNGVVAVVFGAQERVWRDGQYAPMPIDSPNAALVAAAPDLLAALKKFVSLDGNQCMTSAGGGWCIQHECPMPCRVAAARAAIKRAEGK